MGRTVVLGTTFAGDTVTAELGAGVASPPATTDSGWTLHFEIVP